MKKEEVMKWLKETGIKVAKTMAETALSMLTVGMALADVDWIHLLSVTAMSGVITVLFNIKGIKVAEGE